MSRAGPNARSRSARPMHRSTTIGILLLNQQHAQPDKLMIFRGCWAVNVSEAQGMWCACLMASGLNARARVLRVAFHMGSLVCLMLNIVSWNVLVASCKHRRTCVDCSIVKQIDRHVRNQVACTCRASGRKLAKCDAYKESELVDPGLGKAWPAQHNWE